MTENDDRFDPVIKAALGLNVPIIDTSELPPSADWDMWTLMVSLPDEDLEFDDYLAELEAGQVEQARREQLVAFARARARLADMFARDPDLDGRSAARLTAAETERAAGLAEARRVVAAKHAVHAIERLSTAARMRAAVFSCRCPHGCVLVSVFRRRALVDDLTAAPLLLVVAQDARGRRSGAWLAEHPEEHPDPHHLVVGCRHGRGKFPTGFPTYLEAGVKKTRRVQEVTGMSWTPR